jgi:hypothetical protein
MANEQSLPDLRRFLNAEMEFGPDHFGAIGVENIRVFEQLFDSENKIYSRMSFRNPLVIGRRGSGKSTFLQSRKISEKNARHIVVEINSGSLFSAICKRIGNDHQDDFVEVISEAWSSIIDLVLLVAIGGESDAPDVLRLLNSTFCTKYKDSYRKKGTSTTGRLLHYFEDFTKEMISQVKGDVRSWTNSSLQDIRQVAIEHLTLRDRKAVCLVDSLEEYKISKGMQSDALAGLFKCVGEYHANRGGVMHVHLSVPSELFSVFTGFISKGVMKDFSNATWLYWHASELLSVCAKRFFVFLKIYGIDGWESFNPRRANDKKNCLDFLAKFFPQSIQNSSGSAEEPIAYILRHTQLIPRHLIAILNRVFSEHLQNNKSGKLLFTEASVKAGVELKLGEISEDVIVGYREKYPNLQQVLESIIPSLPLYFTSPDIDKQFPKRVKILHRRWHKTYEYAPDATSLLRTLLDVGIVGRVSDRTGVYTRAEFSYTIPSRDVGFADSDIFCFHPAFAKVFRCIYDPLRHKPVYPLGTDPELQLDL